MQTSHRVLRLITKPSTLLSLLIAVGYAEASFPAVINLGDLDGANGFVLTGIDFGDSMGASVSGGDVNGDVNGDGIDDLLIGAPGGDPGGRTSAGESYVVFGVRGQLPASVPIGLVLNGRDGFVLNGATAEDASGLSISFAGDFNNDGFDDLVVGSPSADPVARDLAGDSHLIYGRATGFPSRLELRNLSATNGVTLQGARRLDGSGKSVSSVGDVNGDGIDDLVIGAPSADTELIARAGKTFVVFGRASNADPAIDLAGLDGHNGFVISGASEDDYSGHSVSGVGDFNGDGLGDFVIGAPEANFPGRPTAGASYLIYGRSGGFPHSIDLSTLDGELGFSMIGVGGKSGQSVGAAGDVNGDGLGDLVIGAPLATGEGNFAGESYVVFGTSDRFVSPFFLNSLDGAAGFRIVGESSFDLSGDSVGSAGDLNGDGFDDVVIGARNAGPESRSGPGRSYVIFGRGNNFPSVLQLSDLDGANGIVLEGIATDDKAGSAVGSAGDFNGDGISDLMIGAPGAFLQTGAVYVVFGQRTIPEPCSSVLLGMLVTNVITVSRGRPRRS